MTNKGFSVSYLIAAMHNLKKAVMMQTLDGEDVERFENIQDIVRRFGYTGTCIGSACRGKIKTAYGYKWRFIDPL